MALVMADSLLATTQLRRGCMNLQTVWIGLLLEYLPSCIPRRGLLAPEAYLSAACKVRSVTLHTPPMASRGRPWIPVHGRRYSRLCIRESNSLVSAKQVP